MKLRSHGRYDFNPLPSRPAGCWPGSARLAFYVALNLEQYSFGDGLVEDLVPPLGQPDVMNYSWRDWGNRIGAWRLLAMFRELGFAPSLLVNTVLYETAPGLSEAAETALIREARATIAHHEGTPPRGWLGPWISETERTPDLLHEVGFDYVLDWAMDDQPVWLRTRGGRILSVPYPQELNDANAVVLRRDTGREFAAMIVDQCDELLEHGGNQPLVMGVALHTHVSGQPFRLRPLRQALQHMQAQGAAVWITDTDQIAAAWQSARTS